MPEGRRRLGRGLDALLPELAEKEGDVAEALACALIDPNPEQPRRHFDAEALEELAASIRVHGVLQPVIVRRAGLGRYQLVTGERRLRATVLAGQETIPAIVREFSDADIAEVALVENLQRADLNPLEEAAALQRLLTEFGLTQEELAQRLGKSRPGLANSLRLLQAAPAVREALENGKLTAGHVRALLAVPVAATQEALAARVVEKGLNVRETERLAQQRPATGPKQTGASRPRGPEWRDAEERMGRALGTRVHIRGDERRGTVEIAFFGREDLERLLEFLSRP